MGQGGYGEPDNLEAGREGGGTVRVPVGESSWNVLTMEVLFISFRILRFPASYEGGFLLRFFFSSHVQRYKRACFYSLNLFFGWIMTAARTATENP